jgi:hypothetical protein
MATLVKAASLDQPRQHALDRAVDAKASLVKALERGERDGGFLLNLLEEHITWQLASDVLSGQTKIEPPGSAEIG